MEAPAYKNNNIMVYFCTWAKATRHLMRVPKRLSPKIEFQLTTILESGN